MWTKKPSCEQIIQAIDDIKSSLEYEMSQWQPDDERIPAWEEVIMGLDDMRGDYAYHAGSHDEYIWGED